MLPSRIEQTFCGIEISILRPFWLCDVFQSYHFSWSCTHVSLPKTITSPLFAASATTCCWLAGNLSSECRTWHWHLSTTSCLVLIFFTVDRLAADLSNHTDGLWSERKHVSMVLVRSVLTTYTRRNATQHKIYRAQEHVCTSIVTTFRGSVYYVLWCNFGVWK